MSEEYKVMCGCECCIYAKNYTCVLAIIAGLVFEKLKYQIQNSQNIRSGKKSNSHV